MVTGPRILVLRSQVPFTEALQWEPGCMHPSWSKSMMTAMSRRKPMCTLHIGTHTHTHVTPPCCFAHTGSHTISSLHNLVSVPVQLHPANPRLARLVAPGHHDQTREQGSIFILHADTVHVPLHPGTSTPLPLCSHSTVSCSHSTVSCSLSTFSCSHLHPYKDKRFVHSSPSLSSSLKTPPRASATNLKYS
jgi:hypothetical protein